MATALYFPFDGSDQSARADDSPWLDPSGPFTVEAWVFADPDFLSQQYNFVVSKNAGGTGYALVAQGFGFDKRFVFEANHTGSNPQVVGTSLPPTGQWVHVAGSWAAGTATLFVNGEVEAQEMIPQPPEPNDVHLRIGSSLFGRWFNWQGRIAEVRLWHVARSQAEIQQDMLVRLEGNEPGLVAYWRCEEGVGDTVADSTGHGNTLMLTGVEWGEGPAVVFRDGFETGDLTRWSEGL